jgi:hypothetical protein
VVGSKAKEMADPIAFSCLCKADTTSLANIFHFFTSGEPNYCNLTKNRLLATAQTCKYCRSKLLHQKRTMRISIAGLVAIAKCSSMQICLVTATA